jgi:hypothetical protein
MDGNLGILMLFIFVGFFVLGWGRNMKGLLLLVQNTIQIKNSQVIIRTLNPKTIAKQNSNALTTIKPNRTKYTK